MSAAARPSRLLAALSLLVFAAGCGFEAPDDDGSGVRTPYVVNGAAHSGHPSAGKLTRNGSLCTATLVGKKTVLTAGHCVSPGSTSTFTVGGTAYKSAQIIRHPQYNSAQISNDIALVILQQEVTNVEPAVVNRTVPTVGTPLTIVGYGKTGESNFDSGTKRMATSSIAEVLTTRIRIPRSNSAADGNICNGDSGGPSYAMIDGKEVHIGIHSTKAGSCGSGGHDVRVDAYMQFIEANANGDLNKGEPPDTEAPKVTITSPASGANVGTSITVTTTITDNKQVVRAELLVDGSKVSTASGTSFDFPLQLAPGQHALKVVAYDDSDNQGEATVNFTVTADAPPSTGPGGPTQPSKPPTTPPPAAPGSFGTQCADGSSCDSGMCGTDPDTQKNYCTQKCTSVQQNNCPAGAECLASSSPGVFVCGPPAPSTSPTSPNPGFDSPTLQGGCAVGATPAPGVGSALLLLLALLALRRRRWCSER
ncbi:MAG: trypsin-like serine protease [Myxococcales bacterium]|nr:trypsin-like serine protease [Myxococcales bacterium]